MLLLVVSLIFFPSARKENGASRERQRKGSHERTALVVAHAVAVFAFLYLPIAASFFIRLMGGVGGFPPVI